MTDSVEATPDGPAATTDSAAGTPDGPVATTDRPAATVDSSAAVSPPAPTWREPLLLGLIVLLALVNGLIWSAVVPPWQTPDEPKHFEYVRLLAEGHGLVAFASEAEAGDPELQRWILASMDAHQFWWYGRAPGYDPDQPPQRFADVWLLGSHTAFYRASPAYYWLLARLQPGDRLLGLYLARLVSVLLGALTVLFVGLAARELFPDDPLVRYGAPAFAALHPMFAFAFAGVNSDALVNCLAAFAFLLLARLLARGANPARLVLLLAVVVAAVLVKRTALFLVPTLLVALLFWLALRRRRPGLTLALAGGVVLLALAGLAQWGASGGWERLPQDVRWTALRYFFNEPDQPARVAAFLQANGVGSVIGKYLWGIHNTFWGSFGWQVIHFPGWLYVLLAAVGLSRRRRRHPPRPGARRTRRRPRHAPHQRRGGAGSRLGRHGLLRVLPAPAVPAPAPGPLPHGRHGGHRRSWSLPAWAPGCPPRAAWPGSGRWWW